MSDVSEKNSDAYSNYMNYRYCYDNGHDEWVQTARRCFDFWRNKQWSEADRAKLENAGRPALTLNVIESLIRTMEGIQRVLRNDVRFMPVSDASLQDAQVRDSLWLHIQNENHLDFVETEIWKRGLITNRAYYDVRMTFDDNMQGQIKIKPRRSQDIVLDPCIDSYDPNDWTQVYHVPWMTMLDIKHEFGDEIANELSSLPIPQWYDYDDVFMAQRIGRLPYYQYTGFADQEHLRAYRLIIRQFRELKWKNVFVDMDTGETSPIPESWDRERVQKVLDTVPGLNTMKRRIKVTRHRTTCENIVLKDEESLIPSFTLIPFFPSFIDGVALGPVETLLDPQQMYNKVTSQELAILNTTANSGWKVKRGVLTNMTPEELERIGARPGVVVEVSDLEGIQKIEPNQMPQGHDRMSFKADQIMRQLSGVPNQARGFAREDVAGEAILANQAASDINFAGYLGNLHRSKQILVRTCEEYWKAYYTETRVLMINRGSSFRPDMQHLVLNQPTPEGHVVNDITDGKFTTVLVPSPTRSTMNENELKELIMLRKELGIQIPDDIMIEVSNVPDKLKIIQRIQGDSNEHAQQQRQQDLAAQGKEMQLTDAKIAKEQAAAKLNSARADKFAVEAQTDPDAAYERIELARISAEKDTADRRLDFDYAKLKDQRSEQHRRTALELTKIDHSARESAKDRVVDMTKTHLQGLQRRKNNDNSSTNKGAAK